MTVRLCPYQFPSCRLVLVMVWIVEQWSSGAVEQWSSGGPQGSVVGKQLTVLTGPVFERSAETKRNA